MTLIDIAMRLVGAVVAFTLHEWAHSITAYRLGDANQKAAGRLTLNPAAHLSWQGILLVAVAGFGWARPVRVDAASLRHGRWGMVWVSLAGCAANLVSGVFFFVAVRLCVIYLPDWTWLSQTLAAVYSISVSVGIFNLLPIPPLDGFRAVSAVFRLDALPYYAKIQNIGMILSLVLIVTGVTSRIILPVMDGFTDALFSFMLKMGL